MFSRFLLFFGAAGAGLCATEAGRRRALRGGDRPARIWCTIPRKTLALSSTGTTSLGPKAPPASRTWCFTPRKPLLFRRRAPRLWGQRRCRRAGRGASLPANPCSFVDGHHVFGAKGAAGISSHQYKSQKERIDDGTSGESVPSSISTDFNRNSRN